MASGETLVVFTAQTATPPADDVTYTPATFDIRNNHLVLDFDSAGTEDVFFEGVLPRHYSSGGTTVTLQWMATSATVSACNWSVQWERHQAISDDLDSDSFATAATVAPTATAPSGNIHYTAVTFTNGAAMDSVAVGEHFRMRVSRVGGDASDTLVGDAELIAVEIRET